LWPDANNARQSGRWHCAHSLDHWLVVLDPPMTRKIENVLFVSIAKIESALMNDERFLEAVAQHSGLT
jgi:hypothetical protein